MGYIYNGKKLDQQTQNDLNQYVYWFIELWYPVIDFIANDKLIFYFSYPKHTL